MKRLAFLLPLLLFSTLLEGILLGGALGEATAQRMQQQEKQKALQSFQQQLGLSGSEDAQTLRQFCAQRLSLEREHITVSDWIELDADSGMGSFDIGNAPQSSFYYTVTIYRSDSGEEIFHSGALAPGFCIPLASLNAPLPRGIYPCAVTFTAYLADLTLPVGQLAKTTVIEVK